MDWEDILSQLETNQGIQLIWDALDQVFYLDDKPIQLQLPWPDKLIPHVFLYDGLEIFGMLLLKMPQELLLT